MTNPRLLKQLLNQNKTENESQSLINEVLSKFEKKDEILTKLDNLELLRTNFEITQDFFCSNSLQRCFDFKNDQSESVKILLREVLKRPKNFDDHKALIKLIPSILIHKDPFIDFA